MTADTDTAARKKLSDKALRDKYGICLPGGLSNLAKSTQNAIKSDDQRRLAAIRKALSEGREPTKDELRIG